MARRLRWSLGTLGVLAFACLLAASFAAATLATMTAAVRVLLVVTLVWGTLLSAALLLRALRSRRFAVYVIAGAAALLGIWATVGAREPSVSALRQAYLGTLQSFDGVPYVWGGETRSGIDCSGLARVALWQAMLRRGVSEVNPRLLGGALWGFWWRDMSAKDMLGGRYGYTRVIGRAPKLAGCDAESLHAGDLAVTAGGVHVLIYCGHQRWIEASPIDRKVVENQAAAGSTRGWFNVPVTFVRWWILDRP